MNLQQEPVLREPKGHGSQLRAANSKWKNRILRLVIVPRTVTAITESLPNLKTSTPSKKGDTLEARTDAASKAFERQNPCAVMKRTTKEVTAAKALSPTPEEKWPRCGAVPKSKEGCASDWFRISSVLLAILESCGAPTLQETPHCSGRIFFRDDLGIFGADLERKRDDLKRRLLRAG